MGRHHDDVGVGLAEAVVSMNRRSCFATAAVAIAALIPRVSAQSPQATADGVAAFQRGDYQRAAEILRPIAERFPFHDDFTAEFLMAQLYEFALGVPQDRLRACALYLRASQSPDGLGSVAGDRHDGLTTSFSSEANATCLQWASFGFNHGFQRVTFDLGPGHWIDVDLERVTISHEGGQRQHNLPTPSSGAMFLPIEHAELTGRDAVRRHFVQIATWTPYQGQNPKWELTWNLYEIVKTDFILAGLTTLMTVAGTGSPPAVNLHDLVDLRIGAAGEAEWISHTGPDSGRTQQIATDGERREESERRERERARMEDEQRIDWSAVRDILRMPTLAYEGGNGCANVFLFGWSADRAEAVSLHADANALQLTDAPQTFDLSTQRMGLDLRVHVFARAIRQWPFCTDVVSPGLESEVWRAVAGRVTIAVTDEVQKSQRRTRATARIENARFLRGDGARAMQTAPVVLTAIVGWFAG
jgi:hypothetical protein